MSEKEHSFLIKRLTTDTHYNTLQFSHVIGNLRNGCCSVVSSNLSQKYKDGYIAGKELDILLFIR